MRSRPRAVARFVLFVLAVALTLVLVSCESGYLGDPPAGSPGTVTLRLLLQSPQPFCDQIQPCSGISHVSYRTGAGQWIRTAAGWCETQCTKGCAPSSCPTVSCTGPGMGVALREIEQTWDGAFLESSSCEDTTACYIPRFVLPGRYVARMCATPGVLLGSLTTGLPTCSSTAESVCVEVPFDLPGPGLVEARLPVDPG